MCGQVTTFYNNSPRSFGNRLVCRTFSVSVVRFLNQAIWSYRGRELSGKGMCSQNECGDVHSCYTGELTNRKKGANLQAISLYSMKLLILSTLAMNVAHYHVDRDEGFGLLQQSPGLVELRASLLLGRLCCFPLSDFLLGLSCRSQTTAGMLPTPARIAARSKLKGGRWAEGEWEAGTELSCRFSLPPRPKWRPSCLG